MTTLAALAREFSIEPYELAAFADLGAAPDDLEIDEENEAVIRLAMSMEDRNSFGYGA